MQLKCVLRPQLVWNLTGMSIALLLGKVGNVHIYLKVHDIYNIIL